MADMTKAEEAEIQRRREAVVKRYTEICANIRALDENSFRLLGFVPLQICKWLQERADQIEEREFDVKEIKETQFAIRLQEPQPKFKNSEYDDMHKFWGYQIRQREAEKIIYVTTILAWLALPLIVWLPKLLRM